MATFGNTLWIFFLPLILQEDGLSPLWIGIVYSLNTLADALIRVPVGAMIDRYGRKPAVVAGTLIGLSMPLSLALSSVPLVPICVFVTVLPLGGVLFGLGYWAMISDTAADKPATSFGAFIMMAGWASVIAPSLGGLLLETNQKTVFLLAFLLGLAAAAWRAVYLKETLSRDQNHGSVGKRKPSVLGDLKEKVATVTKNRLLLLVTLAYTVYNLFLTQISFVVPLYSVEVLKLNTAEVGLLFSVFMLVNSQLAVPFGMLADKAGYYEVILASWLGEMALMMVFAYSVGSLMVMLSFSSWVAVGSMDSPAIQAWLGKMARQETRATSLGLFSTVRNLASVPAVAVAGLLYSLSPRLPFWSNLAASAVALAIFLRSARSR